MITSGQLRAARAFLKWSAATLSQKSGVGTATIQRMEVMDGVPSGNVRTLSSLQATLEAAGIEFIGSPEDSPGVRQLTKKTIDSEQPK